MIVSYLAGVMSVVMSAADSSLDASSFCTHPSSGLSMFLSEMYSSYSNSPLNSLW